MEYSVNNLFGANADDALQYERNGSPYKFHAYYYESKKKCDAAWDAVCAYYDNALNIMITEHPGMGFPYEILVEEKI